METVINFLLDILMVLGALFLNLMLVGITIGLIVFFWKELVNFARGVDD